MNKKSVKHLKGINFSQQTLAKKTEAKNFGHAALDLVISVTIKQNMWETLTLLYMLNIHAGVAGLKETLNYGLLLII